MKKVDMTIQSGVTRVLHTAGKYCEEDIVIKAEGGDYDKGYESGVAQGEQNAYDAFWDVYQQNGDRSDYVACFAGAAWTDELYNPKYDIIATQHGGEMFKYALITNTKVPIIIDNTSYTSSVFHGCIKLVTIPSIKVTERTVTFGGWFTSCGALVDIHFTEDSVIAKNISFTDSSALSVASVNSIINALKDLTGQTAQTLTFHSTVKNNLTDAQKATISAKNWTLG